MTIDKENSDTYVIIRDNIAGKLSRTHHRVNIAGKIEITKIKINKSILSRLILQTTLLLVAWRWMLIVYIFLVFLLQLTLIFHIL
jgi:hypothetical protein